ncbi:hypothetical protein M758_10G034600 [Ceratodon purpureus]|nr:hypothetical protein M758_10G034600 [Ceratodon purpureus]
MSGFLSLLNTSLVQTHYANHDTLPKSRPFQMQPLVFSHGATAVSRRPPSLQSDTMSSTAVINHRNNITYNDAIHDQRHPRNNASPHFISCKKTRNMLFKCCELLWKIKMVKIAEPFPAKQMPDLSSIMLGKLKHYRALID